MQSFLNLEANKNECLQKHIDILRENGYVVIAPSVLDATSVKNATELVDLFYSFLQYCNQERKIHYAKASKKDLGLANKFIKHRQVICGNKKKALQECVAIVKCVIKYEELYKFDEPLHSFDYFGNDKMKWVTDKAISIINKENKEVDEEELQVFLDELSIKQETESLSILDGRIDELKVFLGEINDGDEEKGG
jgi:hypothetical protein